MSHTWIPYLGHYERSLIKKFGNPKKPVIAISGLAGTGKGVHAELLQESLRKKLKLSLRIYESGEFLRRVAKQYGYSEANLSEFSALVSKNIKLAEKIDHAIDTKTLEVALGHGGIFVGKLTFAVIGDWGYKIFLKADQKLIAKRISEDRSRPEYGMSIEEILKRIIERDESDNEQYKRLYNVNYKNLAKKCNFIIETKSKEKTAHKIFDSVARWLKKNKYI